MTLAEDADRNTEGVRHERRDELADRVRVTCSRGLDGQLRHRRSSKRIEAKALGALLTRSCGRVEAPGAGALISRHCYHEKVPIAAS